MVRAAIAASWTDISVVSAKRTGQHGLTLRGVGVEKMLLDARSARRLRLPSCGPQGPMRQPMRPPCWVELFNDALKCRLQPWGSAGSSGMK